MHTDDSLVPSTIRAEVQLEVASHFVRATNFNVRTKMVLLEFCKGLAQYGLVRNPRGKFVKAMIRVFVGVTRDRTVFHFHRNELQKLLEFLKYNGIPESRISMAYLPINLGVDIELVSIDSRTPRPDQVPLIDYMVANGVIKIATIDPGRGKTFVALTAIARLKKRTFICIKAMYIEKWIGDIEGSYAIKKGDIMVIRGGASLKLLTQLALAGELTAKFIICSNMTYYNYLKDYETFKDSIIDLGYACLPHQFYELLGVGIRLIDEVHQDIHLNYRQDLYTNVGKSISLSGTLTGDDEFVNGRTVIMFPKEDRIDNGERVIYTTAIGLEYRLNQPTKLRWLNKARKSYSHITYEQSILQNKVALENYKEMVSSIVVSTYRKERVEGQKILIYADFVDMCTALTARLKKHNPELKVCRYVAEDDFDEMMEADIIVSTLKSLGTAQDIPGLLMILMTSALGSTQGNLQAIGRLRELHKWPGTTPKFYYLVCSDIEKHMEYHYKKKEVFSGRVVGHKLLATDYRV